MQEAKEASKDYLRHFQEKNCVGCVHADVPAIAYTEPCCNRPKPPDLRGDICLTKTKLN